MITSAADFAPGEWRRQLLNIPSSLTAETRLQLIEVQVAGISQQFRPWKKLSLVSFDKSRFLFIVPKLAVRQAQRTPARSEQATGRCLLVTIKGCRKAPRIYKHDSSFTQETLWYQRQRLMNNLTSRRSFVMPEGISVRLRCMRSKACERRTVLLDRSQATGEAGPPSLV